MFHDMGGDPEAGLRFSSLMTDDTKSIARGLKQRNPQLLDVLIEQYQFRLFRYLLHLTGSRERRRFFSGDVGARARARHQYDGNGNSRPWLFTIARI